MYGAFCPCSRPLFFNNIQQEAPWRLGVLKGVHGDLVYTFTKPWSDGTTSITLAPLVFLEKRAAIVPLPHLHLVRYFSDTRL
jgi:hypothetical protein